MSTLHLMKTAVDRKKLMKEAAAVLQEKYPELLEKEPALAGYVKLLATL
jgi:hypothetical protein